MRKPTGIVVASIALLCGCGMRNHADLHWTEQVTLASGETAQIVRHVEMWHDRALGGGFSSAPVYKTSTIEIAEPAASFPIWDAPMVSIVLDKDPATGEWIVVSGSDSCWIWARNGRPRPAYWAFRLRDGRWYRDAIPESFFDRPANMLVEFDVTDESDELGKQIAARKQSQSKSPRHPSQYGAIRRKHEDVCDRVASAPIGHDELDLKQFRSLP